MNRFSHILFNIPLLGVLGIFPFFQTQEAPDKFVMEFAEHFIRRDSAAIYSLMHADVVDGTDLTVSELANLIKSYNPEGFKLKQLKIDKRMKAEDESAERIQTTLTFEGPVLDSNYPAPVQMKFVQLWIFDKKRWWLERIVSMDTNVFSDQKYPTAKQNEVANQFTATLAILDKLGLQSQEAFQLVNLSKGENSAEDYRDLERAYERERGPKGLDYKANSMQLFLKAISRSEGGLLKVYQSDFQIDISDKRKPVPWKMFHEYVDSTIARAKQLEKSGKFQHAITLYKKIIGLGSQLLNEQGGYQFAFWGTYFQKQAAEHLYKIAEGQEKNVCAKLISNCSRKLDLLQTALGCLNQMRDYDSLKAAEIAATRHGDQLFLNWGINNLVIFALKGAPANENVCRKLGNTALVINPEMQKTAQDLLQSIAIEPSGKTKKMIDFQTEWVKSHNIYEAYNLN
jgi:hypothetical protein